MRAERDSISLNSNPRCLNVIAKFRSARMSCVAVVMIVLWSLSVPTSAQLTQGMYSDDLPSGIYASPSCGTPSEIWVLAAGHELFAFEDTFFLNELEVPGEFMGHGWRSYGDFFARAFTDGAVEYIYWNTESAGPQPDESALPGLLPQTLHEAGLRWTGARFVPCEAVPLPFSALHGEFARFLLDIEPALVSCETGPSNCLPDLFAAIDKYPDGDLNTAELSRLVRVLIYLGFVLQDEPPAPEDIAPRCRAPVPRALASSDPT